MKFGGHKFLTVDLEREFFDSKGYGTGGDVSWVELVTTDQSAAGKANCGGCV